MRERAGEKVSFICLQQNETSSGVTYHAPQLAEIVRAARAHDPGLMIIVDAISGAFAHPLDFDALDVDLLLTGSQKGLGVSSGLAYGMVSRRALARMLHLGGFEGVARRMAARPSNRGGRGSVRAAPEGAVSRAASDAARPGAAGRRRDAQRVPHPVVAARPAAARRRWRTRGRPRPSRSDGSAGPRWPGRCGPAARVTAALPVGFGDAGARLRRRERSGAAQAGSGAVRHRDRRCAGGLLEESDDPDRAPRLRVPGRRGTVPPRAPGAASGRGVTGSPHRRPPEVVA